MVPRPQAKPTPRQTSAASVATAATRERTRGSLANTARPRPKPNGTAGSANNHCNQGQPIVPGASSQPLATLAAAPTTSAPAQAQPFEAALVSPWAPASSTAPSSAKGTNQRCS